MSRTLTFDEATTVIFVDISTVDDTSFEDDEIFRIALNSDDVAVSTQNDFFVTIIDNDVDIGKCIIIMWLSQVENKQYILATISGLVISLECFIVITPDFLCPFMNG